ncbi:MAG: GntR family transcriptional regulator [Verrucomicrobia bacterium]|nr:GntR family transcriptional regulator [Verrucomicrobiota bacterium]
MEIRLSPSDGLPIYRQIVNQVKYLVASGRLRTGQELPPIRSLAEHLVINPNTVVHAYAELAKEGVAISRHGSGTYVAGSSTKRPSPRAATQRLAPKADSLVTDALHLNVGLEEVVELVRERHDLIKPKMKS